MLAMAALEISNPVTVQVLLKTRDAARCAWAGAGVPLHWCERMVKGQAREP